jgi:hypothetical protein
MINTQQQYIKLNIRGEISIIVMNKFLMTILRLIRRVRQFERRRYGLSLMRHLQKIFFPKLKNYEIKLKKERTSEQCPEFIKKIQKGLY